MRAFVVTTADIARCPARRLDPGHYRAGGRCECDVEVLLDRVPTVAVVPAGPHFPNRWVAALHLDGRQTSWDCTHLHHSTAAAVGCLGRVARSWAVPLGAEETTVSVVQSDPYEILEIAWGPGGGRGPTTLKRLSWPDEAALDSR